ncbi:MAG TPA: ATP-dependent Clp protease adaptor ClpS [Tepidisphaeraceae bacterium]|nr:ATP-dependent Clp protease adaptor ClpS [Tepidisphaeraceae bacterium]
MSGEREFAMADKDDTTRSDQTEQQGGGATAVREAPKKAPAKKPPEHLPPWKVLLHNDDKNDFEHVIRTIMTLTPLNEDAAIQRTLEAHNTGVSLLLTTHKERAELYRDQFASKGLTVTIEPAE